MRRDAVGSAQQAALSALPLSGAAILDTGVSGQRRAGRVLAVADFTTLLGLGTPVGLFNLTSWPAGSNLGSGPNLAVRGAVAQAAGIDGVSPGAALFDGTDKVLYIDDAGAGDPFRITTGSWGAWALCGVRTGTQGKIVVKSLGVGGVPSCYKIDKTGNIASAQVSLDGINAGPSAPGITDIADGRWHFIVGTFDGTVVRLYVDGSLEASQAASGIITYPATPGPLNIGGLGANATNATNQMFNGRVDEAFVTPDVLSEEQIRVLYAVKVAHGLGAVPIRARALARRARRGAPLATADFSTAPLVLINGGQAGATFTESGSLGKTVTNVGAAPPVAGPNGAAANAHHFVGNAVQQLSASDAGLPTTGPRSMGCWFKTTLASQRLVGYGTKATDNAFLLDLAGSGVLMGTTYTTNVVSGPVVNDGQWHFAVVTYDAAASDSQRWKLYLDGKVVASAADSARTTALGGASALRVAAYPDGTTDGVAQNASIARAFITNYAMSSDEVRSLYAKGTPVAGASPIDVDVIEAMDATNLYVLADTLDSAHQLDLAVAA